MPCIWYQLVNGIFSYDYLSHHVDKYLHTTDKVKYLLEHEKYTVPRGKFLDVHLGINIKREDRGITISNHGYIKQ